MSVQSVSIGSMFSWVVDSFKLFGKNFRSLISASVVTLLLGILMCIPLFLVMGMGMYDTAKTGGVPSGVMPMAGNMTMFYTVYGATILISLVLFPPLLIGWLKTCQHMDRGQKISGLDILQPYKDTALWLRGLQFAMLGMLMYIAVFGLFALAFSGVISDFMQMIEAQQAAALSGAAPPPPTFPIGFIVGYFLFICMAVFLQFVYMVGFAEVALSKTPVLQAMQRALIGVLKNALKLVLFLICLYMAFFMVFFIVALILALIIGVLTFIHPALGIVVGMALYIPILLTMYPLMFLGHYFMWKSILGENQAAIPNAYDTTLSV
jgi:hypothetical protein